MDIAWYGHSCFRLTERGLATVVTDPFDSRTAGYSPLNLRAAIVTISHDAPGHNYIKAVKGYKHLIKGPGEFEIGGVFVTGIQTNRNRKQKTSELRNTLYVYDYDGVTVAHLGDLSRVPNQTEIEALGSVNIALVPVGGGGGLNAAKASEMVSLLEPGYVIPMHYSTPASAIKLASLNRFLKEMGLSSADPQPSLKVRKSSIPSETRVVVLAYEH
jgi:L-ascorbate metabolism protein UlaG (beta-lactamase superfamily)